ncbi:hypothetical protein [Pseudomonas sp. Bi70]|uniref:hypothetical protein n=1 Tax=Pseudomonas sp. Bi70 TaxID=2821127 RepID=UPI001E5B1651|nr:hypothetical protein [Pseudomonas sp. Bi70]
MQLADIKDENFAAFDARRFYVAKRCLFDIILVALSSGFYRLADMDELVIDFSSWYTPHVFPQLQYRPTGCVLLRPDFTSGGSTRLLFAIQAQ